MTDLNPRTLPSTTHVQLGDVSALRVPLPALTLFHMVSADQTKVRVCDEIFSVDAHARRGMAAFLVAFIEERQWNAQPETVSVNEGAPPWTGSELGRLPTASQRKLSPEELYKVLAPSVFQVWTCDIVNTKCAFIGSAVAISANRLITNAHVSSGSEILRIQGENREIEVRTIAVDGRTDRAILETVAKGQVLTPVPGVREFTSIRGGEVAFAIGSPQGLDDTFSSGLVSSLRKQFPLVMGGFVDCIQTSAPISGGSSGGGLFDQRGNLLGITTQQVKSDLGQNLNFAIAADSFFRP